MSNFNDVRRKVNGECPFDAVQKALHLRLHHAHHWSSRLRFVARELADAGHDEQRGEQHTTGKREDPHFVWSAEYDAKNGADRRRHLTALRDVRAMEDEREKTPEDASQSSVSSYASPKDHISVASGVSEQQIASVGDAPALERLKRTETTENENELSEQQEDQASSASLSEPESKLLLKME